jgi:hypothetical protein
MRISNRGRHEVGALGRSFAADKNWSSVHGRDAAQAMTSSAKS